MHDNGIRRDAHARSDALFKVPLPILTTASILESRSFFQSLKLREDASLAVICGGRELSAPGRVIDRSDFPFYAIEYIADGEGMLTIHGTQYPLRAGSVFAYGPATPHQIDSSRNKPLVKFFVELDGTGVTSMLAEAGLTQGGPRQLTRSRWFHDLFAQLIETGAQPAAITQAHCCLLVRALISRLGIDARDARQFESAAYETYTRCRQYAEQAFLKLSTVTEWAQACYLDQAYLSRLFSRYADQRPYQFLVRLKMDHAADLLVRHGVSVKEAAHAVGLKDPQHFSRVFKRVYGVSPMHYVQLTARKPARRSSS